MFESLLTTTLSAIGKHLLGKGVDAALVHALAEEKVQPVQIEIRRAVERARVEVRSRYWSGEDARSRDLVTLLDHRQFAEGVAAKVLFRRQPDFEQLRDVYLGQGGSSERWEALEEPLLEFFDLIEQYLGEEQILGGMLREARKLAALSKLKNGQDLLVDSSRRLTALGERQVELLGSQDARLSQVVDLLMEMLDRLSDKVPASMDPREAAYLGPLADRCEDLPLAHDRDIDTDRSKRALLSNVYIDLDTASSPSELRVLKRLGVPESSSEDILAALRAWRKRVNEAADESADAGREMALFQHPPDELGEDHPLRPWVEEPKALQAAQGPLSALEAVLDHRRLVLLGDPGSGKSTFVNHLAGTLARELLAESETELLGEMVFPLRVELRRWSAALGADALRAKHPEPGKLIALVYEALEKVCATVPRDCLEKRLDDSRTLILFDGLDEVPAAPGKSAKGAGDRRHILVEAVHAFARAHPKCRILVTCRVKPYNEGGYRFDDWPSFELAALDDARVERFIRRWHEELERIGRLPPDKASSRRDRLLEELREPDRMILRRMADTPLLLTMLAQVNARRALPESRAELYKECVEQLLWEWEKVKSEEGEFDSLDSLLGSLNRSDVERVLEAATFQAHGGSGSETVDLPEGSLREHFAKLHPVEDWNWADSVIRLMRQRGGLLVQNESGIFTFPHRSFQEYLACRELLRQKSVSLRIHELAVDDIWREVILLACARLSDTGDYERLQAILTELVSEDPTSAEQWRRILVAGQAWLEFGAYRAKGNFAELLRKKISEGLERLMQNPKLEQKQRLAAGLILSDLGVLPKDLDAFVEIPADRLPYTFRIGKYPVTNHQYQRFIDDGGYEPDRPWWTEEARREILEFQKQFGDGNWPQGSRFAGARRFHRATLPVVGISWYEARAYCEWLTAKLRAEGTIDEETLACLPREAEWARVAEGRERRKYPWGGKLRPENLNSKESGLEGPSPVAMYSGGVSFENIFDLCGNAWEWVEEKGDYDWSRKVCGGTFWNENKNINAAFRDRSRAYLRSYDLGFRVCLVAPISRNSEF